MDGIKFLQGFKSKTPKKSKAEKRQSVKDKIMAVFSNRSNDVEVIPATCEITTQEEKILRVAAYCRVSTDEDTQAGSYELQKQYYIEHISRNPDWELAGIYADVDTSYGLNPKIP